MMQDAALNIYEKAELSQSSNLEEKKVDNYKIVQPSATIRSTRSLSKGHLTIFEGLPNSSKNRKIAASAL